MNKQIDISRENKSTTAAAHHLPEQKSTFQLVDNRPHAVTQRQRPDVSPSIPGNNQPAQLMFSGEVIQLMRPDTPGFYNIRDKPPLYYKGEPAVEGRYKFYVNAAKKMSQLINEEAILSKVEEMPAAAAASSATAAPTAESKNVGFNATVETHTIERSGPAEGDQLLSGEYPEQAGEFDPEYRARISERNIWYRHIHKLVTDAKAFLRTLPPGYVGLWRFHNNWREYESHAFQDAQTRGEMVPRAVLTDAITNLETISTHMYESSRGSPAVSFSRSIDALIDASFHQGGADAVLSAIIFGSERIDAAKFLSFVAIPKAELRIPERIAVPRDTSRRERKGEARNRSMKEMEALHIPHPDSGGRTREPYFTVENPFARNRGAHGPDDHIPAPRVVGMILTQRGMISEQEELIRKVERTGGDSRKNIALLREMQQLHERMEHAFTVLKQQNMISAQYRMIMNQQAMIGKQLALIEENSSGDHAREQTALLADMQRTLGAMQATFTDMQQTLQEL